MWPHRSRHSPIMQCCSSLGTHEHISSTWDRPHIQPPNWRLYRGRRASFLQTQWMDQGFLIPPGKVELFGLGREKLVFSPDVRETEQHVPGRAPQEGWWRGRGTSGGWHWGPYKDTRAPRGRHYPPVEKVWFFSVDGVTLRSRKHLIPLFANMITPTDIFH